jgi:hypothetical protein
VPENPRYGTIVTGHLLDAARPFTLVGKITHWDSHAHLLRIADVDVILEPHVSAAGVAVGVVVLVKGRHDERTGLRLVSQLRHWPL